MSVRFRSVFGVTLATLILASCSSNGGSNASSGPCTPSDSPTITFVAYSTPQAVYDAKIIPAFKSMWKDEHDGQIVNFFESYGGSTTQAQNVVNGQQADVVALSLAPDVDTIKNAGLITHDWTSAPDDGMVSSSVVVFDVRPNNPLGIADWNDLASKEVNILTPDPAQSGGARWNQVSMWGAALRGDVPGVAKGDEAGATKLVQDVNGHVFAYDSSARSSIQNFEDGNADVAITYENEVKTANAADLPDEAVYPKGSILIENPVALVDKNVDAHCVRDVAEAFVDFLHSKDAKTFYTDNGYLRSTDPAKAKAGDPANGYPAIQDLYTVQDLGGWDALNQKLFGDAGIVTQAIANSG
jgi:sulfate/thiosulfate transport system substrate-binding protein